MGFYYIMLRLLHGVRLVDANLGPVSDGWLRNIKRRG